MSKNLNQFQSADILLLTNRHHAMEVDYFSAAYGITPSEFAEVALEFALFLDQAYPVPVQEDADFRAWQYEQATRFAEAKRALLSTYPELEDHIVALRNRQMEIEACMKPEKRLRPTEPIGTSHVQQPPQRKFFYDKSMWEDFNDCKARYEDMWPQIRMNSWPRVHINEPAQLSIQINGGILDQFKELVQKYDGKLEKNIANAIRNAMLLLQLFPLLRTNDVKQDLMRIHFAAHRISEKIMNLSATILFNVDQTQHAAEVFRKYGIILALGLRSGESNFRPEILQALLAQQAPSEAATVTYDQLRNQPNYLD